MQFSSAVAVQNSVALSRRFTSIIARFSNVLLVGEAPYLISVLLFNLFAVLDWVHWFALLLEQVNDKERRS